jgi:hypothetical protein
VLSCDYGVNTVGARERPVSTANYVDADALAAYETQDVEGLGTAVVPSEIARWCYNSHRRRALPRHAARAAGRLRRVDRAPRVAVDDVDAHPELTVGDTVVVVTDQYTDYDPARASPSAAGTRTRSPSSARATAAGASAASCRGSPACSAAAPDSLTLEPGEAERRAAGCLAAPTCQSVGVVFTRPRRLPQPAAVVPLPAGATSLVVPHPGDGEVTAVQLEARLSDLVVSDIVRHPITGLPQVPHVELDDSETPTVATQWWKITERGIPVSLVEVQTQVGTIFSAWGPPARGAGAASTVRGGVLGAGEYEHDVVRDATRQSWIMPRLTLANGAPPIVLGPFDFDRNTLPDLVSVSVAGTSVTISADSGDTKAVGLYRAAPSTWKYEVNGSSATIDVAGVGTNGVAGLGSGTADTFTAKALSDPVVEIGVGTLSAVQDVVVSNGASTPAAVWDTVQADAPALFGNTIPIRLKATAAPAGWTAKVWVNDPSTATLTDVSALLSPALSAPPTSLTTYNYTASASRVNNGPHAALQTVTVRAYLYNNLGVIQSTRYVSVTYYVPSTI